MEAAEYWKECISNGLEEAGLTATALLTATPPPICPNCNKKQDS
jgi:hypothetical protein